MYSLDGTQARCSLNYSTVGGADEEAGRSSVCVESVGADGKQVGLGPPRGGTPCATGRVRRIGVLVFVRVCLCVRACVFVWS